MSSDALGSAQATRPPKRSVTLQREDFFRVFFQSQILEAREWIEATIQEKMSDSESLHSLLKNGVTLCRLAQAIQPSKIPKFNRNPRTHMAMIENIDLFIQFCTAMGVKSRFEPLDLFEKKNFPLVIATIHQLAEISSKSLLSPTFSSPSSLMKGQFSDSDFLLAAEQDLSPLQIKRDRENIRVNVRGVARGRTKFGHSPGKSPLQPNSILSLSHTSLRNEYPTVPSRDSRPCLINRPTSPPKSAKQHSPPLTAEKPCTLSAPAQQEHDPEPLCGPSSQQQQEPEEIIFPSERFGGVEEQQLPLNETITQEPGETRSILDDDVAEKRPADATPDQAQPPFMQEVAEEKLAEMVEERKHAGEVFTQSEVMSLSSTSASYTQPSGSLSVESEQLEITDDSIIDLLLDVIDSSEIVEQSADSPREQQTIEKEKYRPPVPDRQRHRKMTRPLSDSWGLPPRKQAQRETSLIGAYRNSQRLSPDTVQTLQGSLQSAAPATPDPPSSDLAMEESRGDQASSSSSNHEKKSQSARDRPISLLADYVFMRNSFDGEDQSDAPHYKPSNFGLKSTPSAPKKPPLQATTAQQANDPPIQTESIVVSPRPSPPPAPLFVVDTPLQPDENKDNDNEKDEDSDPHPQPDQENPPSVLQTSNSLSSLYPSSDTAFADSPVISSRKVRREKVFEDHEQDAPDRDSESSDDSSDSSHSSSSSSSSSSSDKEDKNDQSLPLDEQQIAESLCEMSRKRTTTNDLREQIALIQLQFEQEQKLRYRAEADLKAALEQVKELQRRVSRLSTKKSRKSSKRDSSVPYSPGNRVLSGDLSPGTLADMSCAFSVSEPLFCSLVAESQLDQELLFEKHWKEKETRRRNATLEKAHKQRLNILLEMFNTEHDYLRDLQVIIRMQQTLQTAELLEPHELHTIFSNTEQIFAMHKELSSQLSSSMDQLPDQECWSCSVGPIFIRLGGFMKMYTVYISGQDSQNSLSEHFLTHSSSFVSLLSKSIPELGGSRQTIRNNFHSYLIRPIQRVCKYPLLLRELIRCTDAQHSDLENLQKALSQVEETTAFINKRKKEFENLTKMVDIQRIVSDIPKSLKLTEGRTFIKEGELIKISKGKAQERMFFLFNDLLLYASKSPVVKGKFNFKGKIPLQLLLVNNLGDMPGRKNTFELVRIDHKKKKYIICAKDAEEKEGWMTAISEIVNGFLQLEGNRHKPRGIDSLSVAEAIQELRICTATLETLQLEVVTAERVDDHQSRIHEVSERILKLKQKINQDQKTYVSSSSLLD